MIIGNNWNWIFCLRQTRRGNQICSAFRINVKVAPTLSRWLKSLTQMKGPRRSQMPRLKVNRSDSFGKHVIFNEYLVSGLARRIILAFSIKRTASILFDAESPDESIVSSVYGLKAIATIMLFICYKFLMIGHQPFTNRAYLTEVGYDDTSRDKLIVDTKPHPFL